MSRKTEKAKLYTSVEHFYDFSELNAFDTSVLNLSVGAPDQRDLEKCCSLFEKATKHCMEKEQKSGAYLFQYGPTLGTKDFRETMANFLTKRYQARVNPHNLVMTAGATFGAHLTISTLIDMNGFVFVDEVTYMTVLELFRQYTNIKVIPVPLNEDGADLKVLEENVRNSKFESKSKMFWGMYYTIPQYHNPTGIAFSDDICQNLIKIARKYDFLILSDDVYNLLYYDDSKPLKRLFEYDDLNQSNYKGHVISNGTFSKLLSPGIRVGWMECPPRINEVFKTSGALLSGGAVNNYTGGIVCSLIELELADQQIDMCLKKFKTCRDVLCEVLESLPKGCSFKKPAGGFFIWIKFPDHINCADFNEFCLNNFNVYGMAGQRFSVLNEAKNYWRLAFSFHSAELLIEAGNRICEAAREYLEGKDL